MSVVAARIGVVAALVLCWELGSRSGYLDPLTFSSPSRVAPQFVDLFSSPVVSVDLESTVKNVGFGFASGALAGGVLGLLLLGMGESVRGILLNYVVSLQAIPLLVFYPLLLTIFGLTRLPIVIIVAVVVMVPVTVGVTNSFAAVPRSLVRLTRALDLSRGTALRKVYLPAAVPLLFPSLRLGFLLAMVSAIGMEFVVASQGLGYAVAHSYHAFATDQMYALIVFICLLAVVVDVALTAVENRLRRDRVA
ncbi:ABC transporter permease subunit [Nocardioides sp. YIM 152315]|uniref:ABC transporter permease n=1 Tax=Nocardioides sp. YIM 152315 TaxID=3031760 RepID=UPI0023DA4AC6|nr:ABC transporter permease subunit [Nocardioides sp. YIM 152315]MDF1606512.1 ABC transporter permease subunit [Nocardioides sp. YIM 152315]